MDWNRRDVLEWVCGGVGKGVLLGWACNVWGVCVWDGGGSG
jgi:hypothetical protein